MRHAVPEVHPLIADQGHPQEGGMVFTKDLQDVGGIENLVQGPDIETANAVRLSFPLEDGFAQEPSQCACGFLDLRDEDVDGRDPVSIEVGSNSMDQEGAPLRWVDRRCLEPIRNFLRRGVEPTPNGFEDKGPQEASTPICSAKAIGRYAFGWVE